MDKKVFSKKRNGKHEKGWRWDEMIVHRQHHDDDSSYISCICEGWALLGLAEWWA